MSKKKAVAVLASVMSVGFIVPTLVYAATEEGETYKQDTVIVEGKRFIEGGFVTPDAHVGLLGNKNMMEIPFNVVNINQKTIENFGTSGQSITNILSLNPSVRPDGNTMYNNVSIRGIYSDGHRMYLNGIPGLLCQSRIPTNFIESAEVISGPGTGYTGTTISTSAGGTIELQSKRAKDTPNADFKVSYSGKSSVEEQVDIGRRFGENNQYGIRINASNSNGETSIDHEKLEQRNIFVNLDQKSEKSKTNLLAGYIFTHHQAGQPSVSFGSGVTVLPSAPNASGNFSPAWAYHEYDNWIVALNHEQKVAEKITAFVNAGYHREDWYGYLDGSPNVSNNAGDFSTSFSNYPLALTKRYLSTGIKGTFDMGELTNEYIVSVDKNWYNYWLSGVPTSPKTFNGNLHQNIDWAVPNVPSHKARHSQDAQMVGWSILDTVSAIDGRLQVTMGVHGHKVTQENYNTSTGIKTSTPDSDAICPTFGVVYKVSPEVSVYANHSENFGMGTLVGSTYANAGEILDPAKTKQNEIGVKVSRGSFLHTLSAFEISQSNNIDVTIASAKYLRTDGEQKNKGIEFTTIGAVTNKLNLMGGFMYLDAKQAKTIGGVNDGLRVNGAAKWSATFGAEYKATDDISLLARAIYNGHSTINNGVLDVPSYCKFDLGVKYKTKFNNTPVTVSAMCYNVTGKDYWQSRSGYSSVYLGNPRTFMLSANFEL